MSIESLLILLLIGAVAGWLATLVMGQWGFGLLFNIIIGVVGGVVGSWLLPKLGVSVGGGGIISAILVSTVGAVAILAVVAVLQRISILPRRRIL